MSVLKLLNIKLDVDTRPLEAKMKAAANTLRREGRNFSELGNQLSLAVSLPLAAIGGSAIKAAGDMEAFKMGFTTTMKAAGYSANQASKEMEALREIAKMPGIDFEQALKGSQRLQGVGFSAEKARKILAELANGISMAGGSAQELDGVTRQLAQMSGKGRVLQEDLTILLENMPSLAKVLNDTFGTANADKLREMGVSAQDFIDGVTDGLSKLERVPGGLSNSMVNFGVEVKMALATVGEAINKSFNVTGKLEDFAAWISDAAARFSELSASTQKVILSVVGFTAALGPAIKIIGIYKTTKAALIDLGRNAVEMFGKMSTAVAAAAEKFAAMDKITKATTLGAIVLAVSAIALAYKAWSDSMTVAERVQSSLNDVQHDALAATAAERLEAESLIKVINDETASKAEKAKAMQRLNQIGGEYFKGLSIEKSSVLDINAAYEKYIANLLKAAKIKAAEEKIVELEKKKLALLEAQNEAQSKSTARMLGETALNLATGGTNLGLGYTQLGNIKAELAAIEAQQKALAQVAYSPDAVAAKTGKNSGFSFTPTEGEKKDKKADKTPADTMRDFAKAMGEADAKAAALGSTFDVTEEKTGLIREAIEKLIEQGVAPSDEGLAMLSERYKNLTADLDPLATKMTAVNTVMAKNVEVQQGIIEKAKHTSEAFKKISEVVGNAATSGAQAMWDLAASGETSFKKLGKAALKAAADQVRAAIMSGVSSVVQKALVSVPFPFNIAAGIAAGAAAGVLFNKVLSGLKIPAFAKGGYVDKPTLSLIGEAGPEYVLPEKKIPGIMDKMMGMAGRSNDVRLSGEFRVAGTDLVLVLERAQQQQFRSYGR